MSNQALTDDDRTAIRDILESKTDIEHGRLDEVVWCIKESINSAMILEGPRDLKRCRKELRALYKAMSRLLEMINSLSIDTRLALDHFAKEEDFEQSQASKYKRPKQTSHLPVQSGEAIRRLRIYAEATKKAASSALVEIKKKRKVRSGAKPNIAARSIALHLREILEDFGVSVTSYESGSYMEILNVAFSRLLPTEDQQAYIRHGKWAVRLKDIRGTNFATIVGNGNE
jgi:hypothetical protein